MKYFLLLLLTAAVPAAWGQTSRSVSALSLQPELQVEYGFKSGDYLLLGFRGQRFTGDENTSRRLGFDERQVRLGYEHFWTEHWSWGATARLASTYATELVPEVVLRHRGPVGPLTFGQRLSAERTFPDNRGYVGGPGPDGENYIRMRLDLEKRLPLSSLWLRPRLSYELASQVRFQKDEADQPLRAFSYGSLRGEVGVQFGQHVDITPWFAFQSNYSKTLPQYDLITGKQVSGGNYNQVNPTLGLDLRFTLLPAGAAPDRQQLPSQH